MANSTNFANVNNNGNCNNNNASNSNGVRPDFFKPQLSRLYVEWIKRRKELLSLHIAKSIRLEVATLISKDVDAS